MKINAMWWLGGAMLLGQSANAQPPQPPQLPEPLYARDFEADSGGWLALGKAANVTQTRGDAKTDVGALRFDYNLENGGFIVLAAPIAAGALNTLQSLTFDIKSDHDTSLILTLKEQGGGQYAAPFSLMREQWQRIELAPADFVLQTEPNDPKDLNGKLDVEKIEALAIIDFSQIFVQGDVSNPINKLFDVAQGPRTLWVDNMMLSSKPVPAVPQIAVPEGAISIDPFLRPQISWLGAGNIALQRAVGEKPADNTLQAQYEQAPGRVHAMIKILSPDVLSGKKRLNFQIASEKSCVLFVQLEETSGGKYNFTMQVAGEVKPKMVDADFAEFKPSDDSKDDNGQLDLEKVKQILILDTSGMMGKGDGKNTLWLGRISAQ